MGAGPPTPRAGAGAMPQTLKDLSRANPQQGEGTPPARSTLAQRTEEAARPQPVALEVPVTVHGAGAVDGSIKREPFSEKTRTVLIFANGAVIRLSAPVGPGQLLFLSNENTKKEVVCQVTKSKNYRNVSGYVELEFTEPIVGFWGMRFPGDRLMTPATKASTAVAPPPGSSLPTADGKAERVATPRISAPSEAGDVSSVGMRQASETKPSTTAPPLPRITLPPPPSPPLPPQPPKRDMAPGVPAKEAGESGASSGTFRSLMNLVQSEATTPPASTPSKSETAPLAQMLTPPAIDDDTHPAASIFGTEGIPVPSWFDPAARKNAQAGPHSPRSSPAATVLQTEPLASAVEDAHEGSAVRFNAADSIVIADDDAASSELGAPMFAGRLLVDEGAQSGSKGQRSGRGALMGAIAAVVVLGIAGGAWYLRQNPIQSASNFRESVASFFAPAGSKKAPQQAPSWPLSAPVSRGTSVNPVPSAGVNSKATAPSLNAASSDVTDLRESARKELKSLEKTAAQKEPAEKITAEKQPAKKPDLPEIRLAAPVLSRKAAAPKEADAGSSLPGGLAEPSLPTDLPASGLAEVQPSAPAAPKPEETVVGGDVKPAKLISLVPPVYPPAARNLRISGDVTIDAQIGTNGRVSEMKVISGPPALHQAAMDAVRQWKYQPAMLDGKPVAMHMTVTVRFRSQ